MRTGTRAGGVAILAVIVLASAVRAEGEDPIKNAIDRGVAYLKTQQGPDGAWPYHPGSPSQIGATALAGLALLESDVPPDDPSIQKAAAVVRQASVGLTHAYSISLAIMFLDLLDDPADEPLIESLAVRLLAGQKADGGWTYECPSIDEREMRRLTTLVQQGQADNRVQQISKPGTQISKPPGAPVQISKTPREKMTPANLPREIRAQLQIIARAGPGRSPTDNSNTQFATVALWIARRHGMPVETALSRVAARFRASQNGDGGWGYLPTGGRGLMGDSTATMTCAGLLGLAIGHGSAVLHAGTAPSKPRPQFDPARDPSVRAGLLALGTAIGNPTGKPVPGAAAQVGGRGYYFLWSLERVAVGYGLRTIGKKDWYGWGSEILVAAQAPDGSWQGGEYREGGVDTCFALLFLKRANLAQDLTTTLKGQVQDPGEATLTAGGVGGADLMSKGLAPGLTATNPEKNGSGENQISKNGSPPAVSGDPASQAGQLSTELLQAPPDRQGELIDRFREHKGVEYTQALADVIHKLDGPAKDKARDALAERLSRMTPATLRARLQDDDPEFRSAAALACAARDDRSPVPDLIALLQDPQPRVAKAAHVALKALSGKDLGPSAGAGRAERDAAVAAWKSWWDQQPK